VLDEGAIGPVDKRVDEVKRLVYAQVTRLSRVMKNAHFGQLWLFRSNGCDGYC